MRLSERQLRLRRRMTLHRLRRIHSWRCLARLRGPTVDAIAGFADGICPVG
jgi:hypothetical protein